MSRAATYDGHMAKQQEFHRIQKEKSEQKAKIDRDVDRWMERFGDEAKNAEMSIEELGEVS